LVVAGLVPLKPRECRGDNAGLDLSETAEHLPDLGQWPLKLFSAITNAERLTRESQPIERQNAVGGARRSRTRARVVARRNGKPTAKISIWERGDLGRPLLSH
jgi:hypothetical protein